MLVNGVSTSLRVVRSLADVLVDVNGQAASLALRDTNQQLLLLDRIAGGGVGWSCLIQHLVRRGWRGVGGLI